MKKQKTKKFIDKNSEYDLYLFRNMDMGKEKMHKKRMRNNVKRKKMNKKINLKYLITN